MSKARYCANCGFKFYPNAYSSYPQHEYEFNSETRETNRYEVAPAHKHFHSQSCMKSWIAKNSQSFSRLVDEIEYINNNNNNNNNRERA